MKKIGVALSTTVVIAALTVVPIQSASAATRVKVIDKTFMYTACERQQGTPSYVSLVSNNVMGWRCTYDGGWNRIYKSIDLTKECRRLFGASAYANYTNFNDPNSWGCYR